jgi:hypothetical protein
MTKELFETDIEGNHEDRNRFADPSLSCPIIIFEKLEAVPKIILIYSKFDFCIFYEINLLEFVLPILDRYVHPFRYCLAVRIPWN